MMVKSIYKQIMKTLINKQQLLPLPPHLNLQNKFGISTFSTERKNLLTDNEDNLMKWKQLDRQNFETHI